MKILNSFKRFSKKITKKIITKTLKSPLSQKNFRMFILNLSLYKYFFKGPYSDEYSVFDYKNNVKQKYIQLKSCYLGNAFYCTEKMINRYCMHKEPIKACIEHGIYWGISGEPEECIDSGLPAVLVPSKFRSNRIREISNIKTIEIGPLIHYASEMDKNWIENKKKEFGKTLFVVISHSVEQISLDFNCRELIEYIEKFKIEHNFQTVIVSLYYADILKGRDKAYTDAGYKVFTSGNKYDPHFLDRQKTAILVSDYMLTNSISTHIGYSIFLGRPVTYFKQTININGNKSDIEVRMRALGTDRLNKDIKETEVLFEGYHPQITTEQYDFCNKVWGFDYIKTVDEMLACLVDLDNIFKGNDSK